MKKYTKDNIQTLVATMDNNGIGRLLKNNNVTGKYVVVNQTDKDGIKNTKNGVIIYSSERGLSKSRNLAISESNMPISLLSDDDIYYMDGYRTIIAEAYNRHPDADIIAFSVKYQDRTKTKHMFKEGRVGYLKSLGISSVQISFLTESIKANDIKFDESFGAGSVYNFGEENIFLYDCLKRKLKIYYVPMTIATIMNTRDSSWFRGYNEKYLATRGATYSRMSKKMAFALILQFAIRKQGILKPNGYNIKESIKIMLLGAKKYQRGRHEK